MFTRIAVQFTPFLTALSRSTEVLYNNVVVVVAVRIKQFNNIYQYNPSITCINVSMKCINKIIIHNLSIQPFQYYSPDLL